MGHGVITVPIHASQLLPLVIDLSVALGADDRYQKLLNALRRLFAIDGAVLLECRGDRLFPIARSGVSADVMGLSFPLSYQPVAGNVLTKTPHRHIGAVTLIERSTPLAGDKPGDGVLVALPLFFEDTLVGALNVGGIDPHAFDDVDDDDLMLCGALAGAALRSANLFHRAENLAARLQRINQDIQSHVREQLNGVLLGDSQMVITLRQAITAWAHESGTVLLSGPAGSGHESVAHAIHAQGPRYEQPFVYVNGSRYREPDTAETLLSTDQADNQLSQLQLASGGTLYIEAVDHIARVTQKRLATIIAAQDHPSEQKTSPTDASRIILSVREPIDSLSLAPQLLEAIGERLLHLPALAQRKEDIPLLAQHYAAFHSQRAGRTIPRLSAATLESLVKHHWPGGFQELSTMIERGVLTSTGSDILLDLDSLVDGSTLGHYRLLDLLGEGGFGTVWRARHEILQRDVAIKVINKERLATEQGADMVLEHFKREARSTANLRSNHSVDIYDFGATDDGGFYYAMELLHGLDLASLVSQHGRLAPSRVSFILSQICRSLEEAHHAGLVHRDIKPANIFLCGPPNEDLVKVLDFGLIAIAGNVASNAPPSSRRPGRSLRALVSRATGPCGTPGFIAPEVVAGLPFDIQSDIYALGAVAYDLITGYILFDNPNTLHMIRDHMQTPLPALPKELEIPAELEELIHACLAKLPADRPGSMREIGERLRAISFDSPWSLAHAESWWKQQTSAPPAPRNPQIHETNRSRKRTRSN